MSFQRTGRMGMTETADVVQCQLLKMLSVNPKLLVHPGITESLFSPLHASVYSYLRALFIEGSLASLKAASLSPTLSDEARVIASSVDAFDPPEVSLEWAISFLIDHNLRQELIKTTRTLYEESNTRSIPAADTLTKMGSASVRLSTNGRRAISSVGDFSGINKSLAWQASNPGKLRGPSMGIAVLDKYLNGYWPRYYLIGARPSVGKSSLVGNIIEALCDAGERCLLFTPEMSTDDYRARLLSSQSGVNILGPRDLPMTQSESARVVATQRKMKKWHLWIDDTPAVSINHIESESTSIVMQHGPVHIFIDYIQLVTGGEGGNRNDQIGNVSGRLKRLQGNLHCSVTAAAQLRRVEAQFNRELKRTVTPPPRLDELRESGSLEQDADVAFLLERDTMNSPEDATLHLAKQRSGPTAKVNLKYRPNITTFTYKP
jgi:replicative DNA helicase